MNTTPSSSPNTRALVIGGGGATGNAWALGVIAGLADGGVDVTGADLIVGTSSGSTVAAQVTSGARPADLYAAIVAEQPQQQSGPQGRPQPRPPAHAQAGVTDYLEWSNGIIAASGDAADMRRRMGAALLERDASGGAAGARWRDIVAGRLPGADWPQQLVLITAVDASTGEPVAFDRHSGVELVDAVAASTSSMNPYPIGDGRYIDGGYRRNENADLAAGYASVLVLSPFGGRSRMPHGWGMDLATQVEELRAGGSAVETLFPDAGAGFGANALDPSTRRQAALGGFDQGRALAATLAGTWPSRAS